MKKGTPRHRKTYALARILNINLAHAVGILEMLWQFCADNLPQGDIGAAPDSDIAGAVGWVKRPALLIEALCAPECRWLEKDESHRLIVHDWPDHAEYEVCRKLLNSGKDFLAIYGKSARDRRVPGSDSARKLRASREALALANGTGSSENEKDGEILRPEWDDQFVEFKANYAKISAHPLIQQDWDEAWYPWKLLDFEQKNKVNQSVLARIAAGQTTYFKPANYISKSEFTRPVLLAKPRGRSVMEGV